MNRNTRPTPVLPTALPPGPPPISRSTHRWAALTVLALAQFLVVLDASIVNIALPVLGDQLGMDTVALAWVITAYVLPFGGLLLLGGRLADRYGHRRLFLVGTAGFVTASALAGLSVTGGMLLGARAVQGASAALLAPAALALLTQLFPASTDRAKALGIWGAVAGIGSAAGVLLGGVLTAGLGWQAVFFVNVPVGLLVLIALPLLISRDPASIPGRLDFPGAATITGALVAAVGALSSIEQVGFAHPLTLGLAVAALALGTAFILIERRTAEPLVPLGVFRNRNLSSGNLVMLLLGAAMVALFFALSVYLQAVLGYDALTAGLSQLPLAGALVLVAGLAPALVGRLGTKRTLVGSLLLLAAGLLWLAAAPSDADFTVHILGPSLVIGIGLGGAFITATQLSVDGVEGGEAGLAGGLINTSQQIGGALGLALLASLAAARTAALETAGAAGGEALTGGFSWLFLGTAAFALVGAGVAGIARRSPDADVQHSA
ncbi:MFS transporter [Cryobacterium lactosi]|uniref:MFS transporter n=1 Tax=Cryobacterium lactosi TaxID=1259202 RepID=A0A4R9BY97_9MICO|nr:MFS transporter [Cryobacterium lactosi]TFD93451.1 MFS transporter [Cryobacterium lactosi]